MKIQSGLYRNYREVHKRTAQINELCEQSDYGATGQYSCIYYNLYAASSVTTQGRSCNSAAALFFESFLNNNVPFGCLNELIEFIHNVLNEEHKYNSAQIINNHASAEETFFQLRSEERRVGKEC